MDDETRNDLVELGAAMSELAVGLETAVSLLDQVKLDLLRGVLVESRESAREIARGCEHALARGDANPSAGGSE